ncbi:glycoside hydrolase family 2 protein [Aureliella helgolandensis]|uniref:Beta-galactosidase n=1 Tax=Aureliella helgolandensis TaxID=2527968 RepID=A0A518G4X3_9BACT|nr:sugar-binding domain-containing protein [Aureliella helgolandensis]QDV23646.1 Beta-galactosidase [Aureliella helgolandensis]
MSDPLSRPRRLALQAIVFALALTMLNAASFSQEIVDSWRYTLRQPSEGWQNVTFDATDWTEGQGGFGTSDTPGSRVGTTWSTNNIWLRKSFDLEAIPENPALWMHHDEDAEVFINGQPVAKVKGFTSKYEMLPLPLEKRSTLKLGRNVLSVHCRQTTGGQFIDVHLVNGGSEPTLPIPARSTRPFQSELVTEWGAGVTAENAWTEYPRPQLVRENWTNLNGLWDYAITPVAEKEAPTEWTGQILVPFCLESKIGGVQRLLDGAEALWYRRSFDWTAKASKRQLLNFEAVDYRCEVFVNGKLVGGHTGGNTPFSLDVTNAVQDGANELVVRVEDETEKFQLRGKQTLNARGIWYTQVSGIWQTVWMEEVPTRSIEQLKIGSDANTGTITVRPIFTGSGKVRIVVRDGDVVVAEATGGKQTYRLEIVDAKLWSPASPHLYNIEVALLDSEGQTLDRVESYTGIRTVGKVKDADGQWRFTLNGDVLFHWGPLDQGWWPDGLLTPPSDEAMLFDIEWLKSAGFNMIRKHIKVEPRRYYYHCDRLGMLVWQDQVSGGTGRNNGWPEWTRLKPDPVDAEWPATQHQQFMNEFEEMIDGLENHPSIVVWTPFNEAWGQHQTVEIGRWTAKRDPSRLVNAASGGNFWPVGDIVDEHRYPHPGFPFELNIEGRFDDFIKVMGEFGGHGFPVQGHLWDSQRRNWGYGDIPKTEAEYKDRYTTSIRMLDELRAQGIAAGVYTQTTDVEGEVNGLMTYDRKVIKIPAQELAKLHEKLFEVVPVSSGEAKANNED